jgi:hypothetical protein
METMKACIITLTQAFTVFSEVCINLAAIIVFGDVSPVAK